MQLSKYWQQNETWRIQAAELRPVPECRHAA